MKQENENTINDWTEFRPFDMILTPEERDRLIREKIQRVKVLHKQKVNDLDLIDD